MKSAASALKPSQPERASITNLSAHGYETTFEGVVLDGVAAPVWLIT